MFFLHNLFIYKPTTYFTMNNNFEVDLQPKDTITDIHYDKNLIISSWDGSLYCYSLQNKKLLFRYDHEAPIMKMSKNEKIIFGDVYGNVMCLNDDLKQEFSIKTLLKGIHTLEEYNSMYLVCGWDNKLCLIQDGKLEYIDLEVKSQTSSLYKNQLALVEGENVHIYDLRTYKKIYTKNINEQIRSVLLDEDKLYLGTYNGKLCVLDTNSGKENTVNAHKTIEGKRKIGYPVNQIEKYDKIYTCGSDGTLSAFRIGEKITQKVLHSLDFGILKFKKCDSKLVVCCGYNYEKGEGDTVRNPIYIFDT